MTREFLLLISFHLVLDSQIWMISVFKIYQGVVAHTFNPSSLEEEAGRFLWIPVQSGLHN